MAGSIRDLKVWQESVALAGEVTRAARQGARRETKVLTDRLISTALEVGECVSDGYARYTSSEQRQLYRAAKRALLRLETQIAVGRHADLISPQTQADLAVRIQSVHRVLAGYLVYLDRQAQETSTR